MTPKKSLSLPFYKQLTKFNLIAPTPNEMETTYLRASKDLKKKILAVKHPDKVAIQIVEPIKTSKEPLPENLIFIKISGDKYNVYRTIFALAKIATTKTQIIEFVY